MKNNGHPNHEPSDTVELISSAKYYDKTNDNLQFVNWLILLVGKLIQKKLLLRETNGNQIVERPFNQLRNRLAVTTLLR